jgi:hypothetical protein
VSISPDNTIALISDSNNNLIRQLVLSTASVTTVAGIAGVTGSTNGVGTNSLFSYPIGVYFSPDGSFALVVDMSNYLIRRVVNIIESSPPCISPTSAPSLSASPTTIPTLFPTCVPSISALPTIFPSLSPTFAPSISTAPTNIPSAVASKNYESRSRNSHVVEISAAVGAFCFLLIILSIIFVWLQRRSTRSLIPTEDKEKNEIPLHIIEHPATTL